MKEFYWPFVGDRRVLTCLRCERDLGVQVSHLIVSKLGDHEYVRCPECGTEEVRQ